jgi:hypothetical protein
VGGVSSAGYLTQSGNDLTCLLGANEILKRGSEGRYRSCPFGDGRTRPEVLVEDGDACLSTDVLGKRNDASATSMATGTVSS